MKQHEAVIKVMEENGGYATFKHLYENVLNVKGPEWKTKTPFASIRRIVQDKRFFLRIRPGLWALKSREKQVLSKFGIQNLRDKSSQERFSHYYFQGLLTETGNLKGFETVVPSQDKNRMYLGKKLADVMSLPIIPEFTFSTIMQYAKTVDVVWLNRRHLPFSFFEVEISTNIINSLNKYVELQDFNSMFYVIANKTRIREFLQKISMRTYENIKDRVRFRDTEWVVKSYENALEFKSLEEAKQ